MFERRRRRRALKRHVKAELGTIDVPSPLDVGTLCEQIGRGRGRPMSVIYAPLPIPGPFGLWVAKGDSDLILVQSETSPAHQQLIALHEIGHVMAGHQHGPPATDEPAEPSPVEELIAALIPDLLAAGHQVPRAADGAEAPSDPRDDRPVEAVSADALRHALRREDGYDEDHEWEAETVGSIILNWAGRLDQVAPPPAASLHGRLLQDGLGDHLGWRG